MADLVIQNHARQSQHAVCSLPDCVAVAVRTADDEGQSGCCLAGLRNVHPYALSCAELPVQHRIKPHRDQWSRVREHLRDEVCHVV